MGVLTMKLKHLGKQIQTWWHRKNSALFDPKGTETFIIEETQGLCRRQIPDEIFEGMLMLSTASLHFVTVPTVFFPLHLTPPRMCTRRPCWDFTCFFAASAYRCISVSVKKVCFVFRGEFRVVFFRVLWNWYQIWVWQIWKVSISCFVNFKASPFQIGSSQLELRSEDVRGFESHFTFQGRSTYTSLHESTRIPQKFHGKKRHLPGISMTVRYEIMWDRLVPLVLQVVGFVVLPF